MKETDINLIILLKDYLREKPGPHMLDDITRACCEAIKSGTNEKDFPQLYKFARANGLLCKLDNQLHREISHDEAKKKRDNQLNRFNRWGRR